MMIPAETSLKGLANRGCRCAQPTAKHGLSPPGIDRVSAWIVLRATFQSPLQLRGGLRGDLQCIINDCPCRQCRGEWKLARVASALVTYMGGISKGDILCFRMVCVAGDLPVAPTATRWSVGVIFSVLLRIVHAATR